MTDQRQSGRIKDVQARRVLDVAARRRRMKKALEALDQDNYQDDPHADLKMSKRAPKFEESMETSKKKRKKGSDYMKYRMKRSFAALVEEEQMNQREPPNFFTAMASSSTFPERNFCAVCGFPSNYTCVQCGTRYCCVKCLTTHQDTRCLKWTA
ncbi:zinc finger HIT domain-containing protein 1-like [Tubulanus polymorphus]|uniref:zinc finger HIT domain-containing protein 1-like n=1 Tax=Tubulanus polymorphus TaxID=672921 RepID=UPI003DA2EC54